MAGSIAMSLPPRRKWVIARGMGIDAPFFGLLTLTNFSFACGYFAPISVAGEVLRMGFTKRLLGISYLNSLMLAILDRLFGLAGVMACAALLIPFKLASGFNPALLVAEGVGFVAFFAFCTIFIASGLLILRRIPLPSRLSDTLLEDRRVFLQRFSDLPPALARVRRRC
jgi:hypothetical protein